MRQMSRRRFLIFVVLSAAALIATGLSNVLSILGWSRIRALGPVRLARAALGSLLHPQLAQTKVGPLSSTVTASLMAASATVLEIEGGAEHYRNFFVWRAENVPGYRTLYEEFAGAVERSAQKMGDRSFVDSDISLRRQVLAKHLPAIAEGSNGYTALQRGLISRAEARYVEYILHEILDLFWATDAWIAVGYTQWPGTPRGLEDYVNPLATPDAG